MRVVLPASLSVAFIAIVVAGLFDEGRVAAPPPEPVADTAAGPIIGDHWHATYEYIVCGDHQLLSPAFSGVGIHTHGGTIIHLHPFQESEAGAGARLVKWFGYGGGLLDGDEVRMPGSAVTYKNGDECPDGTIGTVQIFANNGRRQDYEDYIPQDGDHIGIVFGPERGVVRRTLTNPPARLY